MDFLKKFLREKHPRTVDKGFAPIWQPCITAASLTALKTYPELDVSADLLAVAAKNYIWNFKSNFKALKNGGTALRELQDSYGLWDKSIYKEAYCTKSPVEEWVNNLGIPESLFRGNPSEDQAEDTVHGVGPCNDLRPTDVVGPSMATNREISGEKSTEDDLDQGAQQILDEIFEQMEKRPVMRVNSRPGSVCAGNLIDINRSGIGMQGNRGKSARLGHKRGSNEAEKENIDQIVDDILADNGGQGSVNLTTRARKISKGKCRKRAGGI